MPRHSSTMMAVMNHSPPLNRPRSSFCRGSSSLERPRARSSTASSSFMSARQTAATATVPKIFPALSWEKPWRMLSAMASTSTGMVKNRGMSDPSSFCAWCQREPGRAGSPARASPVLPVIRTSSSRL